MDWKEASRTITGGANSARRWSATHTTRVLDSVAPMCAPFAGRWDAEADRRRQLRTDEHLKALLKAQREHNSARTQVASARTQRKLAKRQTNNPLSAARRSARTAEKAANKHAADAKGKLTSARAEYPDTLVKAAARVHAVHAVPAGVGSVVLSTSTDWTLWPAWMSAALIGANVLAVKVGRRRVLTADTSEATAEERRLMERLDPAYWVEHAKERGLEGTVTGTPELGAGGITAAVRLDGQWSVGKLKAAEDQIRSLLGCRSDLRIGIERGGRGGWGQVLLRTRSASDGMSLTWTPDHAGVGVDEVTGDLVDLPLQPGKHILTAGVTGTGKSVSWRPLLMRAIRSTEWDVVLADPKRQEAVGLQHAIRTVGQERDRSARLAALYALVVELTEELHRRQGLATGADWTPDGKPENRRLLIIIDEGAAIVRMSKEKRYADVLTMLDELWGEARAVGFQFIWATQNPTKADGVPPLVKDNMSIHVSLTVRAGEAERAIFGETAQQTGWMPSTLGGTPGRALIQDGKRGPEPVRIWHVTDDQIKALPKAKGWHLPDEDETPADRPALRLVKEDTTSSTAPAAEVPAPRTEAEGAVLDAVRAAAGPIRQKDLVEASGLAKGTVSKTVTKLVKAGALLRAEDGSLTAAAGEVSA